MGGSSVRDAAEVRGAVSALSDQDHAAIERIAKLTGEALHLLRDLEERHGLDLTGPALQALNRAEVSLEFVPREVHQAERYLEA